MTDEQIVKALECCGNMNECKKECPLDDLGGIDKCIHTLMLNALDLIKRQQAEIEDLKADKEALINGQLTIQKMYIEARDKAVREFAEKLKSRIRKDIDEQGMFPLPYTKKAYDTVMIFINNLAKEMTEKEGGKG